MKRPELVEGQIVSAAFGLSIINMFFIYILRGQKDHLYVGSTNNIKARIARHENGEGAEFTRRNKNFKRFTQNHTTHWLKQGEEKNKSKVGDEKRKKI